jgi:hypothetical protein
VLQHDPFVVTVSMIIIECLPSTLCLLCISVVSPGQRERDGGGVTASDVSMCGFIWEVWSGKYIEVMVIKATPKVDRHSSLRLLGEGMEAVHPGKQLLFSSKYGIFGNWKMPAWQGIQRNEKWNTFDCALVKQRRMYVCRAVMHVSCVAHALVCVAHNKHDSLMTALAFLLFQWS